MNQEHVILLLSAINLYITSLANYWIYCQLLSNKMPTILILLFVKMTAYLSNWLTVVSDIITNS